MPSTTPTSGDDSVTGTSGNDTINLLAGGHDTAYGGDGNDRIMSDGGDVLFGGSGIDTLDLRLQNSSVSYTIDMDNEQAVSAIPGGSYNIGDNSTFVNGFEVLFFHGGSGNDYIKGGQYADLIDGGSGRDTIYGGAGNDLLYGHNGNASIFGGTGADTITIDGYVDSIDGSNGQTNGDQTTSFNTHGYGDDDVLRITGTAGFLTGADGIANRVGQIHNIEHIYVNAGLNVSFSRDTDPNTIDHYQQGGAPGTTGVDTYGHQVYVTDMSDGHGGYLGATLTGSQYGDTLSGGKGADSLVGATGNDTLYGGDGNDTLQGGVGGDHIFGGAGDDTVLIYSGANQQPDATVSGGDGVDTLFYNATQFATATTIDITQAVTTPGLTNISGFEILNYQASSHGDTVHAGALNDTLWGGSGDDFIFAGADSHAGTGLGSTFNDIVDGMGGQDTVGFIGQSSDFTFQHDGAFILATNAVTNEHVDLKNVEYVSFNNGTDTHALSDFIV